MWHDVRYHKKPGVRLAPHLRRPPPPPPPLPPPPSPSPRRPPPPTAYYPYTPRGFAATGARPPQRPPRPRCYRWVLTDCAANSEARCVTAQATQSRHPSCHLALSNFWAMAKGIHGPEKRVFDEPRRAPRSGLGSLALTRDGAPPPQPPSLACTFTILICRSCSARYQAASSSKTPRCSKRTRAAYVRRS